MVIPREAEPGQPPGDANETLRAYALAVYVLYLVTGFTAVPTLLIGVVLAYVKRPDAKGSPFESHFDNAIVIFWVALIGAAGAWLPTLAALAFAWSNGFHAGWLLPGLVLTGLGYLVLFVWILVRTITGLVRALEARAYA